MTRQPNRDGGFALVTALWAALVLAIIVALIVKSSRTDAYIAHNAMRRVELDAIADAGIVLAELRMIGPNGAAFVPVDGFPSQMSYGGYQLHIIVRDQAGLIDINSAPAVTLTQLFLVVGGQDVAAAETLSDRVQDWREKGIGKRLNGAKATEYAAAGYAYGPREGAFQSVEELRLVLGMTEQVFDKVAPAITVYSQKPFVDPQVAPQNVLMTLPGMTPENAIAQVAERMRRDEGQQPAVGQLLPLTGRSFEISVSVSGADGTAATKSVVVRLTGDRAQPFWVYRD